MNHQLVIGKYFRVFVTALSSDYENVLAGEMIKNGYSVAAGVVENKLSYTVENTISSLIVLNVFSDKENITVDEVIAHLTKIISDNKIFVYSLIVTENVKAVFCGCNIYCNKKETVIATQESIVPQVASEKKRKMN